LDIRNRVSEEERLSIAEHQRFQLLLFDQIDDHKERYLQRDFRPLLSDKEGEMS
jgi:hypothetical protein